MSDLISRSALIEHIKDVPTWIAYDKNPRKYPVGMYDPEDIINSIENAPTIEPYGTWIPCSERLPGMGKKMLTTDSRGHVTVNKVLLFCDDVPVFDSYYRTGAERIIAWMPLPEPYEEESEDE